MIPLMIRSSAKYRLFLLMLLLITGSCTEDFLDVENKNQVALNSFYRNKDDVWMAVNTAYNPLAFGGMFGVNYFLLINSFDDRILFETSQRDVDDRNAYCLYRLVKRYVTGRSSARIAHCR